MGKVAAISEVDSTRSYPARGQRSLGARLLTWRQRSAGLDRLESQNAEKR